MQDISMLADESVEQQILQLLASGTVLSLSEITVSLVGMKDLDRVRQVLNELRQQKLVTMRARRQGMWYMGYTLGQDSARHESEREEIPQPFREFLSRLTW